MPDDVPDTSHPTKPVMLAEKDSARTPSPALNQSGFQFKTRKPRIDAQVVDQQIQISKAIAQGGITPDTLASLSSLWLRLEQFKRSLRKPAKSAAPAAAQPAKPAQEPSQPFSEE